MKILLWLGVVLFAITGCKLTPPSSTSLAPRLTEQVRFANFTVSDITTREGASNLMSEKVYIGTENPGTKDYDWLVSDQGKPIHLETVSEYTIAKKSHIEAPTTFDMAIQSQFESVSGMLDFMTTAIPSKQSFLNPGYFMNLPVSILTGSLEGGADPRLKKEAAEGKTLKDYTKPGALIHLQKFKVQGNTMTFFDADNEYDYVIKELARGDWDGDGFEDALILVGVHTQGSLGWSETKIVTMTKTKGKGLKVIDVK